jgi:hypothetical protein
MQIVEFAPFAKDHDFSTLVESDLMRVGEAFYEVLPAIKTLGQRTASKRRPPTDTVRGYSDEGLG